MAAACLVGLSICYEPNSVEWKWEPDARAQTSYELLTNSHLARTSCSISAHRTVRKSVHESCQGRPGACCQLAQFADTCWCSSNKRDQMHGPPLIAWRSLNPTMFAVHLFSLSPAEFQDWNFLLTHSSHARLPLVVIWLTGARDRPVFISLLSLLISFHVVPKQSPTPWASPRVICDNVHSSYSICTVGSLVCRHMCIVIEL